MHVFARARARTFRNVRIVCSSGCGLSTWPNTTNLCAVRIGKYHIHYTHINEHFLAFSSRCPRWPLARTHRLCYIRLNLLIIFSLIALIGHLICCK